MLSLQLMCHYFYLKYLSLHPTYFRIATEKRKILSMWFGEICSSCSLTVLPGPAWVLHKYVLERIILLSVLAILVFTYLVGEQCQHEDGEEHHDKV